MKKHLMQFKKFDQSRIGRQVLYIFPLPRGPRCIVSVTVDPVDEEVQVEIRQTDLAGAWPDISGISTDLEDAFGKLYHALFAEPDTRFTKNGRQVVFPTIILDVILHDRVNGDGPDDGGDARLQRHMENFDDLGAGAPAGEISALIMCVMLESEYNTGSTKADIWQQRAWLKRGLARAGFLNPMAVPRPVLHELAQSPQDWNKKAAAGIASDLPGVNWTMIYNAFSRSYRGAMVVDVWQPWAINGSAYQILLESDIEI